MRRIWPFYVKERWAELDTNIKVKLYRRSLDAELETFYRVLKLPFLQNLDQYMFWLSQLECISKLVIACHILEWRVEERALLLAILPAAVSACARICMLSYLFSILFTAAYQKHIYYIISCQSQRSTRILVLTFPTKWWLVFYFK